MERLGLTSLRLPTTLRDLDEGSPAFAGSAVTQGVGPSDLAAWLRAARKQPATALEWGTVLRAVRSGPSDLWQRSGPQLVSLLAWVAQEATQTLQQPALAAAGTSAAAPGDPRLQTAARNTLKLALFFLCCIAKGEHSAAEAAASAPGLAALPGKAKQRGRGGGDDTAAVMGAATLQIRCNALVAVAAIEDAVLASRQLLPAVADLQAAGRLAWATALHCVAHPMVAGGCGAADRGAKALAESCHQAVTGILCKPFVGADERQAHAPAALALRDLLGVVSEHRQQSQVLSDAAQVVAGAMARCTKAGTAIISGLVDRILQLAAASGGTAGQQADGCLKFAAMLAAPASPHCQTALLLWLPQLLPLAAHASASTRRLALELLSSLLPRAARLAQLAAGQAGSESAQQADLGPANAAPGKGAAATLPTRAPPTHLAVLLAAVVGRLGDRDATLRAKALGRLEKHAALVAPHLGAAEGAQLLDRLVPGLCGRLCDKSASVRKRAASLLAALLQAGLPSSAASRLADAALPVAAKLLSVRPDSALHPGEEGAKLLGQAVLAMAQAGGSRAALLHLLRLAGSMGDATSRQQLQAAMWSALLQTGGRAGRAEAPGAALLSRLTAVLSSCTRQEVAQLRAELQAAPNRGGTAAAVVAAVQLCYRQLCACCRRQAAVGAVAVESCSPDEMPAIAAALYVLGPLSTQQADCSAAEAGLLLGAAVRLAADGSASEGAALFWLLKSLLPALKHLIGAQSPATASQGPEAGTVTVAALVWQSISALQGVLLSPAGSSPAVREAALDCLLVLPQAAQATTLRCLAAAAEARDSAASAVALLQPAGAAQLAVGEDDEGRLLLVEAGNGCSAASGAESGLDGGGSGTEHAAAAAVAGVQLRAMLALLDLLGGMAGRYEQQRAAFLRRLKASSSQQAGQQPASKAGRPLRPAAEWWVGDGVQQARPPAEPTQVAGSDQQASEPAADYMRAESEAAKHEAAAERYIETLLQAADTSPACFIPLLEHLAAGEGKILSHIQGAALRCLGRLAVLSEPLCSRAVRLAERILQENSQAGAGAAPLLQAAVAVLEAAIDSFPNSFNGRLLLVGQLMTAMPQGMAEPLRPGAKDGMCLAGQGDKSGSVTHEDEPAGTLPASPAPGIELARDAGHRLVAQCAAAAYCRLLLGNKLKLQGLLGPAGAALAHGAPPVAAAAAHALRQMLAAAPPRERARLCLDLFHQTPLASRRRLAELLVSPASRLLAAGDLASDVLTSQALHALLAAAGVAGQGAAADQAVAAAAGLLCGMRPSAKVLTALAAQLQAGGGGGLLGRLPPAARQALVAFVGSHVPQGAAAGGEPDAGEGTAAQKRKRGGSKGGSASRQQHLLQLLGGGSGRGNRGGLLGRPPRRGAANSVWAQQPASGADTATSAGVYSMRPTRASRGQRSSASGTAQGSRAAMSP